MVTITRFARLVTRYLQVAKTGSLVFNSCNLVKMFIGELNRNAKTLSSLTGALADELSLDEERPETRVVT